MLEAELREFLSGADDYRFWLLGREGRYDECSQAAVGQQYNAQGSRLRLLGILRLQLGLGADQCFRALKCGVARLCFLQDCLGSCASSLALELMTLIIGSAVKVPSPPGTLFDKSNSSFQVRMFGNCSQLLSPATPFPPRILFGKPKSLFKAARLQRTVALHVPLTFCAPGAPFDVSNQLSQVLISVSENCCLLCANQPSCIGARHGGFDCYWRV
eukprot:scaffold631_cov21-Tisochrysis_lutea.AAC.3